MERGKSLENKFRRWMKESDVYIQRFYDAKSMGRVNAPAQPADFWVFHDDRLTLVECKEVKSRKSLPFTSIRPSQVKGYLDVANHGGNYLLLVEINNVLYAVYMCKVYPYMKSKSFQGSISLKWFEDNACKIKNRKEIKDWF